MCKRVDGIIAGDSPFKKAARAACCNSWDCADCGPRKKRRLIAKCFAAQANRGFDLTIRHREDRTLQQEADLLQKWWRNFRRLWNRNNPNNKIRCISVWEIKGPRHVHLHCLARCGFIPVKKLRAYFWEHLRSHKQWIKPLDTPKKQRAYAIKYVGKDPAKLEGKHRYSVSKHFWKKTEETYQDPELEGLKWRYVRQPLDHWKELRTQEECFLVVYNNWLLAITRPP